MMEGGSQVRWGNHLGYLLLRIPMKHQEDPLDHVLAAKKIGDRKKASLEGIFSYWSGALLMGITSPTVRTKPQCYNYSKRMSYFTKQSHLCSIMSERPNEIFVSRN